VKVEAIVQSMLPLARCAASAAPLVSVITSNEVPTASVIGRPSRSTSAGTITKPPPMPKKPVRTPVTRPVGVTRTSERLPLGVAGSGRRRSIAAAAASRSSAKASSSARPLTSRLSAVPAIAPAAPAAPKASAVLIWTRPLRA
jgi:hypothetical protein